MLPILITRAGTILLAVCLGVGWMWICCFWDRQWIDHNEKMIIVGVITLLAIVQQGRSFWEPFKKRRMMLKHSGPLIERYLKGFLREYYMKLSPLASNPGKTLAAVRVNLMLPRLGLFSRHLQIYSTACPPGISYLPEETSLTWKLGQGNCGKAWEREDHCVYDSKSLEMNQAEQTLSEKQRLTVQGLNSAISVPICYLGQVVGVLNLDSQQNINLTHFDNDSIVRLVIKCADSLGPHCHSV